MDIDSEINFIEASQEQVMEMLEIYNYYISNSTATFDLKEITIDMFLHRIKVDNPTYKTYLAKIDDAMIGFCFYIPYSENPAYDSTVEIGLYLRPEFTGRRYGEKMVNYLEHKIKEKNFRNIIASVSSDNIHSINLFTKIGYEHCADYKDIAYKHGHYVGIVDFQKMI